MSALSRAELELLRRGVCPHCRNGVFMSGPREDLRRFKLCAVCLREYVDGLFDGELAHEVCPPERLKEVYGISVTHSKPEEEFP